MDPLKIIKKYYKEDSKAFKILVTHSMMVSKKSLEIAGRVPELNPDLKFIKEAAMLHDIGCCNVDTVSMDIKGKHPYMHHGSEGKKILVKEGFPKHAQVCIHHTGVGLTKEDAQQLKLPKDDYQPETLEEEIICFADLFYSKSAEHLTSERTIKQIEINLKLFSEEKVTKFQDWCKKFKEF